jgi:hypothetical protein
MPLFRVTIHGRNFRLNLEGKWEKFGFCTPRVAEAPDSVLAEHVALEDFRQSAKYLDLIKRSLNPEDNQPILCGEDIVEVSRQEETGKRPAGLALYRESDE